MLVIVNIVKLYQNRGFIYKIKYWLTISSTLFSKGGQAFLLSVVDGEVGFMRGKVRVTGKWKATSENTNSRQFCFWNRRVEKMSLLFLVFSQPKILDQVNKMRSSWAGDGWNRCSPESSLSHRTPKIVPRYLSWSKQLSQVVPTCSWAQINLNLRVWTLGWPDVQSLLGRFIDPLTTQSHVIEKWTFWTSFIIFSFCST